MEQTNNVNLAGYLFTIETNALAELEKYTDDIKAAYSDENSAAEIVSDIEERIAELLRERCGRDMVVSLSMVRQVMGIVGDPKTLREEDGVYSNVNHGGTKSEAQNSKLPRRIYRNTEDRVLAGVFSGIAARFDIDVIIPRVVFVLLPVLWIWWFDSGIMWAICPIAYLVLWICIPAAKTVEQKCAMLGKPLELGDFAESAAKNVKNSAHTMRREFSTSPAVRVFVRVLGSVWGIILLLLGLSGLAAATLYHSLPNYIEGLMSQDKVYLHSGAGSYIVTTPAAFMTDALWVTMFASLTLFSIWLVFNGVILAFHLKCPKWKPGLSLFVLWIISLLAIAVIYFRQSMLLMS